MALPPPRPWQWIQDRFSQRGRLPDVRYKLPKYTRGPQGWILLGGTTAMCLGGLIYYNHQTEERLYRDMAKFNERYERAYVLQAIEEASYKRRKAAMVDREREWMANQPSWVVNQSPFYTQKQERPAFDNLDPRGWWQGSESFTKHVKEMRGNGQPARRE